MRLAFETDGVFVLDVDGTSVRLEPEDVEVRATSHEELALAQDGGVAVALDTRVDHDLKLEGLAREVIRALNDLRKAQGLEIADRIEVWLAADGDVAEAVGRHRTWIAGEVLARELHLVTHASAEAFTPIAVDAQARVKIERV